MKINYTRNVMLTRMDVAALKDGQPVIGSAHIMWYLLRSSQDKEMIELHVSSVRLPGYSDDVYLTKEQKEEAADIIQAAYVAKTTDSDESPPTLN